jgi:hypothetical protein
MRAALPLALALLLGLVTTIGSALALAAWMPQQMYPRQDTFDFIADGRPWSAAQRHSWGVWNLWWNEWNTGFVMPPPTARELAASTLRALIRGNPQVDPSLPTTAEAWLEYARAQRKTARPQFPIDRHDRPPPWGTFDRGKAPPRHVDQGTDHGFGWPLPALWYRVHGRSTLSTFGGQIVHATVAEAIEGGYLIRGIVESRGYGFRALPYFPSYSGLLVNTAFFAALWALLLFGPGTLRRRWRVRRGHCRVCGYDVQGNYSQPCPECGSRATDGPTRR